MTDKLLKIWINYEEDMNRNEKIKVSEDNTNQPSHPIFGKSFKFYIFQTYVETVEYNSEFKVSFLILILRNDFC